MKKVIALVAVLAATSTAHAGDRWYNNGQTPHRDAAVAVVTAVGNGLSAAAQAAVDAARSTLVECSIEYRKQAANIILIGAGVGSGEITCESEWGGRSTNRVDMLSLEVGPGIFIGSEAGTIKLYGVGATAHVVLGALATAQVRWAAGEGQAVGLAAGVLAGQTATRAPGVPNVVAGYFHATTSGVGAAATVGVTGLHGRFLRPTPPVPPVTPPVNPPGRGH